MTSITTQAPTTTVVARWDQYISINATPEQLAFARAYLTETFGETITADMAAGIEAARQSRELSAELADEGVRAVRALPVGTLSHSHVTRLAAYADQQARIARATRDLCAAALESIDAATTERI